MKPGFGSAKGRHWRKRERAVSGVSGEGSREGLGAEESMRGVGAEGEVEQSCFGCDFHRR